jgi:hypothetical protein
MEFTAIMELNEALRPTVYNYGRLRLDNYLVVVAENDETDDCLTSLENNGLLPLTVAWFSREDCKVRIYQRVEGIQTEWVDFSGLFMSIRTGSDVICLVASPFNRLRDYDDLGDESFLEVEPAALNEQALKVLQSLIFLTDCLSVNDPTW